MSWLHGALAECVGLEAPSCPGVRECRSLLCLPGWQTLKATDLVSKLYMWPWGLDKVSLGCAHHLSGQPGGRLGVSEVSFCTTGSCSFVLLFCVFLP